MAQTSELDSSSIHVVEIPVPIKEETFFLGGQRIAPDVHNEPGKFFNPCSTFRFRPIVSSFFYEKKRTKKKLKI